MFFGGIHMLYLKNSTVICGLFLLALMALLFFSVISHAPYSSSVGKVDGNVIAKNEAGNDVVVPVAPDLSGHHYIAGEPKEINP